MSEILPCPFCDKTTDDVHDNQPAVGLHSYPSNSAFVVHCVSCGACGPVSRVATKAITGWNSAPRSTPTEQA